MGPLGKHLKKTKIMGYSSIVLRILWAAAPSKSVIKFVTILNSKKSKLRELRDQISRLNGQGGKAPEDDESSEKTNSFDGESDDNNAAESGRDPSDSPDASKDAGPSTSKGRKRTR